MTFEKEWPACCYDPEVFDTYLLAVPRRFWDMTTLLVTFLQRSSILALAP
jgi:hypothetical protein